MVFAFPALAAVPVTASNLWTLKIDSKGDSSPAIAPDGTIYFGTFVGQLWAVTPDGRRKWTFSTARGKAMSIEIRSSPAIGPDGTIYFGCRDRKLYALSPEGKEKWAFATGGWVDSSPAVTDGGAVYFGSWDGEFYALDAAGNQKWQFACAPIVSSPAVTAEGLVVFGAHNGVCYALNPTGGKAWELRTGGPIVSSPAVGDDGAIYITSVDGFLYALNRDGSLRWKFKTGSVTESSPVLGPDGTVYLGVNNELWAISGPGTKDSLYGFELPVESTPLVLADDSVCGISAFSLMVNVKRGAWPAWMRLFRWQTYAAPGISDSGVIYDFDSWTNFTALKTSVPLANSSWPKFRANARNTGVVNR